MVIGRGFVVSGAGYVSTPATRAAARAAGTFGAETRAGSEAAAAELTRRLTIRPSGVAPYSGEDLERAAVFKAKSDALRRRVVAAKAAGLTLAEYDAKIVWKKAGVAIGYPGYVTPTRPTPLAPYVDKIPPTAPPPTPPPTPPTQCPRGVRYTKLTRWSACDPGYVSTKGSGITILGQAIYPYMPGNECVCIASDAGKAIVEAEAAPKPSDLPGDDGILPDGDGLGLGKIGDYIPIIIGGAIVVAVLGLFKR